MDVAYIQEKASTVSDGCFGQIKDGNSSILANGKISVLNQLTNIYGYAII